MSKKKLAVIIPSLRGGGAERVMINIIKGLNRDKFDIRLILIKKEGAYIDLIPEDVSVVDLDADRVRYSFRKLIKAINEYRPDRILSTLGHLNLALLLIKPLIKGKPKIFIREANTPSRSRIMMNSHKRCIW